MAQYTINSDHATLIAIDQHARSCNLSALDLSTGEARRTRLSNCPAAAEVAGWAAGWATPLYLFAYKSGPCGFALQRELAALGHDCEVIAVTSIARDDLYSFLGHLVVRNLDNRISSGKGGRKWLIRARTPMSSGWRRPITSYRPAGP